MSDQPKASYLNYARVNGRMLGIMNFHCVFWVTYLMCLVELMTEVHRFSTNEQMTVSLIVA